MSRRTWEEWPVRRWVAVIGFTPLLGAAFVVLAGTPLGDLSGGWYALMGLAAILSAGVLGSYVPPEGFRPDLGCAPCAVMPGVTVVGAMIAVNTYGAAVVGPALATAITLFGLTQRLSADSSCDVSADPRVEEPVRSRSAMEQLDDEIHDDLCRVVDPASRRSWEPRLAAAPPPRAAG